jgi:murein DD-endopeptidase MepM/ murein hydrolase activator NlpD
MINKKRIRISKSQKKTLHEHLDHHVCHYYHKHFHVTHHSHHHFAHLWELVLVLLVWCMSWMFAGWVWLPSNNSFVYPLQQVSTVECRTQYRNTMDPSCKLNIPRITNANYSQFKDSTIHRQIYTVLFAASYSAWRDQTAWAHIWVDIATARGTPLYSIGDGQVTYAGRQNGYGNVVKIKYLFKWQYIHAVYAHMDTIQVEAGQKISAGKQVGTVGNSGTTFGALGWFHVHFEIAKDNRGRPMYGYNWCPDLSKWHMTIVQQWLCREELLANQYDPIVLFEQNKLGHVIPQQSPANRWAEHKETKPEDNTEQHRCLIGNHLEKCSAEQAAINNREIRQNKENTTIDTTPQQPTAPIPSNPENPITETQTEPALIQPKPETIEQTTHPSPEIQTPAPEQQVIPTTESSDTRIGEKITFDTKDLSAEAKHFFTTHDMYINNHTGNNNITVGSSKEIEINFYRKWTDTKFVWILPFILDLIPSQTSIISNINTLQLISPNPSIIKIQWVSQWRSSLILSIDNNTVFKILYTIQ